VEKAWMAKGLTKGLMVCRYAFKRVPGQPDLKLRDLEAESEELKDEDDE
jgi:E3 ubiquitin-protein ligase UHRF1